MARPLRSKVLRAFLFARALLSAHNPIGMEQDEFILPENLFDDWGTPKLRLKKRASHSCKNGCGSKDPFECASIRNRLPLEAIEGPDQCICRCHDEADEGE